MKTSYFYMHFDQAALLLTEPIAYASHEWVSEPQQVGPDFRFVADSEKLDDYLMNNANLPLMSGRMKALLAGVGGAAAAAWHQVDVLDRNGRAWPYHIPVFPTAAPVLNRQESEMVEGVLVEAVFDAEKLDGLDFFPVEPGVEIRLVVSDGVKERLEKANMTGMAFSPVTVR